MTNKKRITIVAGLVASIVLLVGLFYKVNFHEFWISLKKINIYSLLFCASFISLSCILRAYMWRITTTTSNKIGLSILFGGVVVGYMVNGILPFRAGELFRAQYLSSMTGLRRSMALSTIFIERLLDIFSLGLLLIVSLFFRIHGISLKTAEIVLLLWLIVVGTSGLLILNLGKLEQHRHKLTFIPQRLLQFIVNFLAPLNQLREVNKIVYLIIISIFVWTCNYLALLALIYHSVPMMEYKAAVLLFLFTNLGMLIPAAPGSLGVMQLAFWLSLSQFGVPKEQALALSFVYLAVVYSFNLGIGLPYFLRAHLRLSEVPQQP